ncbi:MarR family transcriptional regulator [Kitasatospora sp. MAP5-34]|uniref:MarR family winged helix-turn-helix transcriptional regulator n=1 Tax=Kitasatospora sp. MAP5-34 TaxID=3035102 RepID=UPI0024754841|nr:MarR family transcriptional regulator [Kitasatospora sp. MAP5-34]MDH6580005.1 DNA-binding MarR family transcriptional regulator [Kitasatospora sp. MAP5-34]
MNSSPLDAVVRLCRAQTVATRQLDRRLAAHGISFGDFLILTHLASAEGARLRRVDLAERLGLTPSGVTRALGPLERIGLVDRQSDPRDARASYASLSAPGRRLLADARVSAEAAGRELFGDVGAAGGDWDAADLDLFARLLARLGGTGLPTTTATPPPT